MAAVHWYIARNKQRVGPFTPGELQQLAAHGLLRPEEMLWAEGQSKWVAASGLPWLFPPPGQKRYWLSVAGQARGPYAAEQIRAALAARQVGAETLACPEGERQWTPLAQCAEFRASALADFTPSQARLLAGSMDVEEAEAYLAGKSGDDLARLLSTLLELKKRHSDNATLAESLEKSIEILRTRRGSTPQRTAPPEAPPRPSPCTP